MSLLKSRRFYFILAAILFVIFFIVPPVIGMAIRGTVQSKIQAATGSPAKVGSVWVHYLPPGATLSNVELGDADPKAGNKPVITVSSLGASVSIGTVFGGDTHVTGLTLSGVEVNAAIDANGRSSFTEWLRKMPPPDRKTELAIDSLTLKDVKVSTYLDPKLVNGAHTEGTADGVTQVDYVYASSLVLPPPGQLLSREIWSDVDLRGIRLSAPSSEASTPSGAVANGASVKSITLQLAQATSTSVPVKVRNLQISNPELATVYTKPGEAPALPRAILALQLATGGGETPDIKNKKAAPPAPTGTGILVSDMKVSGGRIETRGPDASGKPAYWRLNDFTVDGKNVAFGPDTKSEEGELTIASPSESTSGAGQMKLAITKLNGGYPKWTCHTDYKLDGVAAPAFNVAVEESANTKVNAGQIGMQFAGPIKDGDVEIDGSLTLSKDFEVSGGVKNVVVKLARGEPIKTVRIRGPLDGPPSIKWPDAIAGALGNAFEKILSGSPVGVLDTAGSFMGAAGGQGVREAEKVLKSTGDVMKKVPGLSRVFGSDQESAAKK